MQWKNPDLRSEKHLLTLLSVIAGMTELLGFITLGNIFAAHMTGNLVLVAADLVSSGSMKIAQALTIPMFVLAIAGTWLIATRSKASGAALLRLLLVTQFAFLVAVVVLANTLQPSLNPHRLLTGIAAMMAICAMGCQFTLRYFCFPQAPSTVVMTSNLANAVLSFVGAIARTPASNADMLSFERHFRPVCGFVIGGASAALAVYFMGSFAWVLPAACAAIAIQLCPRQD